MHYGDTNAQQARARAVPWPWLFQQEIKPRKMLRKSDVSPYLGLHLGLQNWRGAHGGYSQIRSN